MFSDRDHSRHFRRTLARPLATLTERSYRAGVHQRLRSASHLSQRVDSVDASMRSISEAVARSIPQACQLGIWLTARLEVGGKCFVIGNGGSALLAEHFAADSFNSPFAGCVQAIPSDPGVRSMLVNDKGWQAALASWLKAVSREGDTLLVISTSGGVDRSSNLVAAARVARHASLGVGALLPGKPTPLAALADSACRVHAQSATPGILESVFSSILHAIAKSWV